MSRRCVILGSLCPRLFEHPTRLKTIEMAPSLPGAWLACASSPSVHGRGPVLKGASYLLSGSVSLLITHESLGYKSLFSGL